MLGSILLKIMVSELLLKYCDLLIVSPKLPGLLWSKNSTKCWLPTWHAVGGSSRGTTWPKRDQHVMLSARPWLSLHKESCHWTHASQRKKTEMTKLPVYRAAMRIRIQKIKLLQMTEMNCLNGPNWDHYNKGKWWYVYQVTMNLGTISVVEHILMQENKQKCLLPPVAGKTHIGDFYFLKT